MKSPTEELADLISWAVFTHRPACGLPIKEDEALALAQALIAAGYTKALVQQDIKPVEAELINEGEPMCSDKERGE